MSLDPLALSTRLTERVTAECPSGTANWYALWTHSHYERLVHDQLSSRGFRSFLPTIDIWSLRGGIRRRIPAPMFPGYIFLQHEMDKASYIEIRQTKGLVCILGERWDRLAVIASEEMAAIQTICQSGVAARPHTFLREGQRIRITRGPLTGVEGILIRQKPNIGLLVVSIDLLSRSVAVELDCTWVESA